MVNRLAMFGGEMTIKEPFKRYNSIGAEEVVAAKSVMKSRTPLSGYLGGRLHGGPYVQRLEELWSQKFHVKHSIACNSATSGLLAACVAAGVRTGSFVVTSPFTMSATAAAPAFLGAQLVFGDINDSTFDLTTIDKPPSHRRATIVTNLFGHPAHLAASRTMADRHGSILIEDNAQGILAKENGKYAGTIGHMGVFSLNVHKHIQCGEGGIVCTNDNDLALRLRGFVNHGELYKGGEIGLNLRMTEINAAIAIAQLNKVEQIVADRVAQAEKLINALKHIDWITPPVTREGCTHVYYVVPFKYEKVNGVHRDKVVEALNKEGVPLVAGYVTPLNRLNAFKSYMDYSVADKMHDHELFYFSNCEWSPTDREIVLIAEAFDKVDKALQSGELK